jgi:hypothetical protein
MKGPGRTHERQQAGFPLERAGEEPGRIPKRTSRDFCFLRNITEFFEKIP